MLSELEKIIEYNLIQCLYSDSSTFRRNFGLGELLTDEEFNKISLSEDDYLEE